MRSSRRIASMKIAVLGTGDVGRRIASKLVELGHEVCMGSRSADHEGGLAWVAEAGERASLQTFADAAAHGEIVFNCASGKHTLAILQSAGASNLAGKVLVDVANPLDFSNGFPPTLTVCNDDSLAEQRRRGEGESRRDPSVVRLEGRGDPRPRRRDGRARPRDVAAALGAALFEAGHG